MGAGIAQVCAVARYRVTLVDLDPKQLDRAKESIDNSLGRFDHKKKLSESVSTIMARIEYRQELAACGNADMAIEAVYEDIEVKTGIIRNYPRSLIPPPSSEPIPRPFPLQRSPLQPSSPNVSSGFTFSILYRC